MTATTSPRPSRSSRRCKRADCASKAVHQPKSV
jgi:hypothetical protein